MEKYGVAGRYQMQKMALEAVRQEINGLMNRLEKTAADEEKLASLRERERELQEALADQNDG